MYYQTLIETNEKSGKSNQNKSYFELDKTDLSEIESRIIEPFLKSEEIQFDGYFLKPSEIKRITIKETQKSARDLADLENQKIAQSSIIMYISPRDIVRYEEHTKDITTSVFDRVKASLKNKTPEPKTTQQIPAQRELDLTKIFIVHGQDDLVKTEAARFVERLGFVAVILHEQASSGKTIIEKIESNTNVGFALVLYTPCDIGSKNGDSELKPRARQNVVFEHGYLIAKLGRQNVCALVKDQIEIPNDISGVVYVPFDKHGAWHIAVAKELRNAGYPVDMNKVIQ